MNDTCGCCEGLEPVTPVATANRPGLDALAYRVGTHATFLETMKSRLSAADFSVLDGLTTRAAGDPSVALLDAWATVADVLTFYQERIANEGYLRTATERRSILELARLVGYVPRPGVAASVYLALTLEEGYEAKIPAGTRAQSLPGPGELPQFFETSEDLEARSMWNVLKPRLTRPQALRPTRNGDTSPRRLYLKGVNTGLGPNDPVLIDFGATPEFFRVQAVEPDAASDRTLVTLSPVVTVSEVEIQPQDISQMVDRYLDPGAYEISRETRTAERVIGLLEDLRGELAREVPPEELAVSLRERVLPQVRQDLDTARARNYSQLSPWLEDVESGLRDAQERLSAATGAAPVQTPAAPEGNGKTSPATLDDLLERLGKHPSVPPASAARLPRTLETSFGSGSDAVPQLLGTLRPELGRDLYRAWEQTGREPGTVSVYAFGVDDSPFGHNAPKRPILSQSGTIERYEEWTLRRTTEVASEEVEIQLEVEWDNEREGYVFGMRVRIGTDSTELTGDLEDTSTPIDIRLGQETGVLTISGVEYDSFLFRMEFPVRRMLVVLIHRGAQYDVRGEANEATRRGGPAFFEGSTYETQIGVLLDETGEFEVFSRGSDPTDADARRTQSGLEIEVQANIQSPSTAPTEVPNVVSLGTSYGEILPGNWVVLERPPDAESSGGLIITQAEQVGEATRADYGITAKGTQITLSDDWIDPDADDFTVIRGTSVYAASELLEPAEAPIESSDGGLPEPVCGGRIELDGLYDGLEPGRWLMVSGERDDLPGVTAGELVMLAGVEQLVQQVRLTTEDLHAGDVGDGQVMFSGRGSTGPGGYDLTISARLLPDGSATGYAALVGGAAGEVVGISPPDDERDFWCINVRRTDTGPVSGDQRINWYIRDKGDGVTTFDEISFVTSIGGDCTTYPDPLGSWLPLTEGDFVASMDLPDDTFHSTLVLAGDLAYCYRRETCEIYANVVNATHGETHEEVLGSGDGGAAFQRFGLQQSPLTHVAATTPSGVRSTLDIYVNDIRWHEADNPSALQPADRGFVTQTDDEGKVTVVFGDGKRGSRLPSGVENVRAVYRTGIGAAGNVAERQISLLVTSPLGLKGVINPLPATGGADRETRDDARQNAPLGVKVLDRLVSVPDYEDFARAFAGIGKASATRLSDGRREIVHLTIAGAGDIPIAESSELYRHLLEALHRFGDPQQPVRVETRELNLLVISARVRLLPDHLWESVEPKIRAALLDAFGFEVRDLGQDALLNEVIGKIQPVPGVSYVDVDTFGAVPEKTTEDGVRRPLSPDEIAAAITNLVQNEPLQRVRIDLAGSDGGIIRPAGLAFLTPTVQDTLILKEITA